MTSIYKYRSRRGVVGLSAGEKQIPGGQLCYVCVTFGGENVLMWVCHRCEEREKRAYGTYDANVIHLTGVQRLALLDRTRGFSDERCVGFEVGRFSCVGSGV